MNADLTTTRTADLLNVSHRFLLGLLKDEKHPFHFVGGERRVRFDDLMRYKGRIDVERRKATAASVLLAKIGTEAEIACELAYRLYTISDRKKRAPEALSYNGLVQSWPEIIRLARASAAAASPAQVGLFA